MPVTLARVASEYPPTEFGDSGQSSIPDERGRVEIAEGWLRALAEDVLSHESCRGCRINAAQALADLGVLEETLTRVGVEDPRSLDGLALPSKIAGAVELRRVGPDDWQVWRDVRLQALADAPDAFSSRLVHWESASEAQWRERLADVPFNVVAGVGGRLAGQASGTAVSEERRVELISMWVEPFARGAGVGIALIDAVIAWAQDQGAVAIILSVKRTNDRAMALYTRAGFVGTREPAEAGEVVMIKEIDVIPRLT